MAGRLLRVCMACYWSGSRAPVRSGMAPAGRVPFCLRRALVRCREVRVVEKAVERVVEGVVKGVVERVVKRVVEKVVEHS